MECVQLTKAAAGGAVKLEGCLATPIDKLLPTQPVLVGTGTFIASDGASTQPIPIPDLRTGYVLHSAKDGSDLTQSLGGPLRVVYPEGSNVTSICGKPTPLTLKGVTKLVLTDVPNAKSAPACPASVAARGQSLTAAAVVAATLAAVGALLLLRSQGRSS